jgi:AhpD family alkylhydroperoxidase
MVFFASHVTSGPAVSSGLHNPDEKDTNMTPRLNPYTAAPEMVQAFLALSNAVAESGLEKSLLELVKIRSSQINGCANCINMHTFEARQAGETEQRIYLTSAWHEAPCYTDRERAALAWTEALTLIADKGAPNDDVYAALDAQFSKEEQVKLTMMINVINGWNRLAVAFHLFDPSLGWKA